MHNRTRRLIVLWTLLLLVVVIVGSVFVNLFVFSRAAADSSTKSPSTASGSGTASPSGSTPSSIFVYPTALTGTAFPHEQVQVSPPARGSISFPTPTPATSVTPGQSPTPKPTVTPTPKPKPTPTPKPPTTYAVDGKNPTTYTVGGKTCDATLSKSTSKRVSLGGATGTLYFRFSITCHAAWAKIVFDKAVPSGASGNAKITRNNDGKSYTCGTGGNKAVAPGQTSCYTGMVYDGPGDTATAYSSYTSGGKTSSSSGLGPY